MSARRFVVGAGAVLVAAACASRPWESKVPPDDGVAAFETVRAVLQHPRCQNCHIPGDAPLQFDDGRVHGQNVKRGPKGEGAVGFPCSTCHGVENAPEAYGPHAPPGAPAWRLPPPEARMVFIGLSSHELAARLKDVRATNGKDLEAMVEHVANDPLVGWGWHPGASRAPVPIPRAEFVAAFRKWVDAGAPLPPVPTR